MDISRLAAAILALTLFGMGAQAPAQTNVAPNNATRPAGAALAIPELLERLARDGYKDFSEIERKSDKLYKVSARNAQGRILELAVDARTAEVLASEEDEDGR